MSLKVLSYNILRGGEGRETQIGAVINTCAPDLVIFQEAYSAAVVDTTFCESVLLLPLPVPQAASATTAAAATADIAEILRMSYSRSC